MECAIIHVALFISAACRKSASLNQLSRVSPNEILCLIPTFAMQSIMAKSAAVLVIGVACGKAGAPSSSLTTQRNQGRVRV